MKTKTNGDIVYEDISKAVSFRRWWHGIVYLLSFFTLFYYLINYTSLLNITDLNITNILLILVISLFLSFISLFLFTIFVLIIFFLIEKLLAFLNIQMGRSSLKLFLSYFKKNYDFSYSDYLKYLIIKTERKLDDSLNRGVYLDEIKKAVKELKFEFVKIQNSLNEANMSDLNPLLIGEIKSVIFSLEEILQLKEITLENKKDILDYLNKLEKTIFSEDFKGLSDISLKFEEAHKNSYSDKIELLFKLIPKKYFYGGIFFVLFVVLLIYTPEFYKNMILIIYVFIIIGILCFIRKE